MLGRWGGQAWRRVPTDQAHGPHTPSTHADAHADQAHGPHTLITHADAHAHVCAADCTATHPAQSAGFHAHAGIANHTATHHSSLTDKSNARTADHTAAHPTPSGRCIDGAGNAARRCALLAVATTCLTAVLTALPLLIGWVLQATASNTDAPCYPATNASRAGLSTDCHAPLPPSADKAPANGLASAHARAWSGAADLELNERGVALLSLLRNVSVSPAFIFGHHNTDVEGQHFLDLDGLHARSDVEEAVGAFPGMWGYNLAWVVDERLEPAAWQRHVHLLRQRGGVLHLFWQAANPVTGGDASDLSGDALSQLLPGGSANAVWSLWLDRIAAFLTAVGSPAAVFRPFHEGTGRWFWWGTEASTPALYRAAWRYTVRGLQQRGVHSLLYAYAPSKPADHWEEAYGPSANRSRYPGDEAVDIACFDSYGTAWSNYTAALLHHCERVADFAAERGKVPAICEFGLSDEEGGLGGPSGSAGWYERQLLAPILQSPSCRRVAWAYTWRNGSPERGGRGSSVYWVPLPNQTAWPGFARFFASDDTIFAGDHRLAASRAWNGPPLGQA